MIPKDPDEKSMDIASLEELFRHRDLIESLNEGFGVVNENNVLTYVNKRFGELLEYSPEEMTGQPIGRFLNDKNRKIQLEQFENRRQKRTSKYELDWISKSGRIISTLISGVPIVSAEGEHRGSYAVITDLTAYKAAERKYRMLAEQSLQGLTVIQNEKYVYVNPAFGEIVGYSVDEIIAMTPQQAWDLVYPEDKKYLLSIAEHRKIGKSIPMPYEYRFRRRDGAIRWVQAFSSTIEYEGAYAVQVLVIDITETKEFEENLRKSEVKYRSLAEQSPQGITILTRDRFLYYNPAFRDIVGYSDEELSKMTANDVWDLVYPDDRDELTIRMRDKIAGRPIAPRYEYRFVRKNGQVRWVESFSSQVDYENESAVQTVIVDITDRRQSERQLQSVKDRALLYLDLMGHDLAQQLQVILNSAALMRSATDDSRQDMFYGVISDAVKRCSRIIEEAKSTEQLLSGELVERSFKHALRTCIAAMATTPNVTFETKITEDPTIVRADEYLELLISNILMNAVEHNSKEHCKVWIELEALPTEYVLSISDDGPGIQDTTKAGIFDMSRRYGGLGLHTSNHLAEKYGGRIELHNRVAGNHTHGLKVKISLPRILKH
ncbi:PAS domain S-box protein [Candidatus Thorarchaeota archaeon]|nr:MAG: PAS domain S-box protein [Candidatus Thorarchaeota archaeon]